jgi:hypothetical protein
MGLNFGAGLPSAGESPRGGDHGDRQKHWKVNDRQGRSACPHAAIELEQTLSMEWHRLQAFCREFATLFPALLGGKNACNWAIHGCVCAFTEPAVMSVADQSPHRHATKHFHATNHPIIEAYDPPEGWGWGWCCVDEIMFDLSDRRRRKDPEILLMPYRAAGGAVKAWAMPA